MNEKRSAFETFSFDISVVGTILPAVSAIVVLALAASHKGGHGETIILFCAFGLAMIAVINAVFLVLRIKDRIKTLIESIVYSLGVVSSTAQGSPYRQRSRYRARRHSRRAY